jgi:hypothetical protein
MAYGPVETNNDIKYQVSIKHNPSGNSVVFVAQIFNAQNFSPPEAQQDTLFQTFLTKLSELANVTATAVKVGGHTQTVTP